MKTKRTIPPSELIINTDGSVFHLHIRPEQLADKVILVGDPARVDAVASRFERIECNVSNREFHTVTGWYGDKRITVQSHGIGSDNIDIVLNELDALANIDFDTRQVKDRLRKLTLVRVGTSGGLQDNTPIGSYVAAKRSIGFDGVMYFYSDTEKIRDAAFEAALQDQLEWKIEGLKPYVIPADKILTDRICREDILRGVTIAANGFYGPQGRRLRLPLKDEDLNRKIQAFDFNGSRITNYEMESSSLVGLATLMGHEAVTVCCIIAGRKSEKMNTSYQGSIEGLIDLVLERI